MIHADADPDPGGTRDVGDSGGAHTTDLQHQHGGSTGGVAWGGGGQNAGDAVKEHSHEIANDLSTTTSTIPKILCARIHYENLNSF